MSISAKKLECVRLETISYSLCQVLFSKQTDSEMHEYGVQVTK